MKKNLLLLTLALTIGLFSFTVDSKQKTPMAVKKLEKNYMIESTYSYYDNCGQILFVTVQCSGSCDVDGNMLDAADTYASNHRDPCTGCYF